jgi:antagonist of KipI
VEGRAVLAGDLLPLGTSNCADLFARAGTSLPPAARPPYALASRAEAQATTLDAIPGPQQDAFTPAALRTFYESEYTITAQSDRMGYRLEGPPLEHAAPADILSEGIVAGSVQVPADGRPILLLADRQTTGGYTKIAVLASASLPLLVHCPPGEGRVRFRRVSVEQAQANWRSLLARLERIGSYS